MKSKYINKILALSLVFATSANMVMPAFAAESEYVNSAAGVVGTTESTEDTEINVKVTVGSTYSVKIPKTVVLDGQSGIGEYAVGVSGNISGTETISVTPDSTVTLSQAGKSDIVATITQDKKEWTSNTLGTNATGQIKANLTAGEWNGSFDFNIGIKSNELNSNTSEYNKLLYKWEPSDGIVSTEVTFTQLTTTYINQQDMPKIARFVVTAPDGKNVLDEILTTPDSEPSLGWIDEPDNGRFRYSIMFINQYKYDPANDRTQGFYILNSIYNNTEYTATDCKIELYVPDDGSSDNPAGNPEITPNDENKTVYRITKDTEVLEIARSEWRYDDDPNVYYQKISDKPYFTEDSLPGVTFRALHIDDTTLEEGLLESEDGKLTENASFIYQNSVPGDSQEQETEPLGIVIGPIFFIIWEDCDVSLCGCSNDGCGDFHFTPGVWMIGSDDFSIGVFLSEMSIAAIEFEVAKEIDSFTITPETPVIEIIDLDSETLYKINNGYFSYNTIENSIFEVAGIQNGEYSAEEIPGNEVFTPDAGLVNIPFAVNYEEGKVLKPGIYLLCPPSLMKDDGVSSLTVSVIK